MAAKAKPRQILPRQIPPKAIEREYAAGLLRLVVNPAKAAYAPVVAAVRAAAKARKERRDYDPDEPRDPNGEWSGTGVDPDRERAGRAEDEREARYKAAEAKMRAEAAAKQGNASRRPLGELHGSAPRGWDSPNAGALQASYRKGETYPWSFDNMDMISLPGHLYRGMSAEEYGTTVGQGRGVISDNRQSLPGEGVSFGYEAATASSYANTSDRSPVTTGKPTYIVEVRATPEITYSGYANYPQTAIGKGLGQEHITRVFKFEAPNKELEFHEITVPTAKADHMDASDRQRILRLIRQGAAKLKKSFSKAQLENLASKFAQRTQTYQRIQLKRQVREVLGADPLIGDKLLSARMSRFVKENVSLVTRIPERLHGELEDLVSSGVEEGWPSEFLAGEIESRFGIAERHARMIARDQISKVYADVNHDRQQEMGVRRFIWRTVHDERVRGDPTGKYPKALPSHYDLDGQTFDYDDPPQPEGADDPIMPGEDYQCRCYAEPVLDDVLDDEDGEDEESREED